MLESFLRKSHLSHLLVCSFKCECTVSHVLVVSFMPVCVFLCFWQVLFNCTRDDRVYVLSLEVRSMRGCLHTRPYRLDPFLPAASNLT